MFNETIKKLMLGYQDKIEPAPAHSIPLFVDVGAEIVVAAAFKNNTIQDSKVYSSLPIIACSIYYPNIMFTLTPKKEIKEMKKLKSFEIHEFQEFSFENINEFTINNPEKCFLFCLSDKDTNKEIQDICTNILNPLGIGAFYSKNTDLFTQIDEDVNDLVCEFLPYSMEIVRKMLFQYNDEDFSIFSVASLAILQYPLPKIIIPKPNLEKLKDRFIFTKFIINNPPLINDETMGELKSFKLTSSDVKCGAVELTVVSPNQWVHITIHHFSEHFQPEEKIEALIGSLVDNDIDLFEYNEFSNVSKEFHNNEVDIIHPNGGKLYIKGIKFDSKEDLPIFVDVFLNKV